MQGGRCESSTTSGEYELKPDALNVWFADEGGSPVQGSGMVECGVGTDLILSPDVDYYVAYHVEDAVDTPVLDTPVACLLSTEKEEDAKKAAAGKDMPTYLMSTDKKEDAKKAYMVQDIDAACLLSTEEEDAKKAAAGKDVPTYLMSTDMKEDAKKACEVQDIDAACLLSTKEEDDAKKAAAGKNVPTYLMSTDEDVDAQRIGGRAAEGGDKCFFGKMEVGGFVPEGLGRMGGGADVAGGAPLGPPSLRLPLRLPSCPISGKASELDVVCDMLGVSKLVGKASEFNKQIECPTTHGKNEPAYPLSNKEDDDAKKAYHVQDVDAACQLSTEEEEDAKKAAAEKSVPTSLMSTDKEKKAEKRENVTNMSRIFAAEDPTMVGHNSFRQFLARMCHRTSSPLIRRRMR